MKNARNSLLFKIIKIAHKMIIHKIIKITLLLMRKLMRIQLTER